MRFALFSKQATFKIRMLRVSLVLLVFMKESLNLEPLLPICA